MQNKIIYSLRVYLSLQELGFEPIATMPNPNNNNLMCWVFNKTPELLQSLDNIIKGGSFNETVQDQ